MLVKSFCLGLNTSSGWAMLIHAFFFTDKNPRSPQKLSHSSTNSSSGEDESRSRSKKKRQIGPDLQNHGGDPSPQEYK